MPTITVTPNPTPPAMTSVHGAGFDKRVWVSLVFEGNGATTKFKPRPDGTFDVGLDIGSTKPDGIYTLQARKAGTTTVLATADVTVKKIVVVPPPVDPVPTVTVGPIISNITASSADITWTVSEKATGWIDYGISTAYGSSTPAETSFDYSTHAQVLSGLPAKTLIYFRVVGKDSAGQVYFKTGQFTTLDTVVVPPPVTPPSGGIYPANTTLSYKVNTDARPGYLAEITDSSFGTKVKRISNVHMYRNYYVSQLSFNKDGTRLIFFPGYGLRILDGKTFADLGAMSGGVDVCHWSNLDSALLYGTQTAAGAIRTNTGVPGAPWVAYASISGWPYLNMNYGMLSKNDNVALIANSASDGSGTWRVIVYDLPNKSIQGYVDLGFQPSSAQLSIDGNYVQINRQNNGAEYMYAVPHSNTVMQPMTGGSYGAGGQIRAYGSHMVMAELADGTPVSVSLAGGGEIRRCDTNAMTPLFVGTTAFNSGVGGHLSYTNRDYPGWVLASTGVQTALPGHDQIVAIKLDGSGTVRPYAEAHACRTVTAAGYAATPFAISNRDMTKVLWGSAWDGNENTEVYAFVAWMPATVTPPPTSGTYPATTPALTYKATNNDPRPAYLVETTDSTWGNKIRRMTSISGHRNQYAKYQTWNADQTLMFFPGYGGHMYDAKTYADLGGVSTGIDFALWSNINPDYLYGTNINNNAFKRYSVKNKTTTVIHTFAGYVGLSCGNYEGTLSENDRVALIARDSAGQYSIIVYDIPNDAVISSRVIGPDPDNSQISRSGDYVFVGYVDKSGTGPSSGSWLYKASDMTPIRQITQGNSHQDMCRLADGSEVYVGMSQSGVRCQRLDNGQNYTLLPANYAMGHVGYAYNRPGWAYLSSTENTTNVGNDQIFAVALDGSGKVQVFTFAHHGTDTDYNYSPFAAPNRDGTLVVYGTRWGGTEMYSYVSGVST